MIDSTLCYLYRGDEVLMMHRTRKKNDMNHDKWIAIGGRFEDKESPEDCALREVREETGFVLTKWRFHGIVTFVFADIETEYMHLFTADGVAGGLDAPLPACDEGVLEWIGIERIMRLNIWEGDKIFFRLIDEDAPFFSLKLVYDVSGVLQEAVLNGKRMDE